MKIIVQDSTINIDEKTAEESINNIIGDLNNQGLIFSHFIVEGNKHYISSIESFVSDYHKHDKPIELVANTKEQFIIELCIEGNTYVKRVLPILQSFVNKIYIGEEQEGWLLVVDIIDGLEYINNIFTRTELGVRNKKITEKLNNITHQLFEPVDNKDVTLFADITQYELIPLYEEIKLILEQEEDKAC